jgi:hypothetical protein
MRRRQFSCIGRNGRVHILLQQIWGVDSSVRYCQLISALEWLVTGLLTLLSYFPFVSPLRAGSCHHIVIELYIELLLPYKGLKYCLHAWVARLHQQIYSTYESHLLNKSTKARRGWECQPIYIVLYCNNTCSVTTKSCLGAFSLPSGL